MNILGLKVTQHDPGAALLSDESIVAISEERLNRKKHSNGVFPELAIQYCLDAMRVKPEDLDLIVMDQVFARGNPDMIKIFRTWDVLGKFKKVRIEVINHHNAHAASAFFCSPFAEAAVFICDGSGEMFTNQFGVPAIETETLYHGKGNELVELHKCMHIRADGWFPNTWGIARLYAYFSTRYLGFGGYNEGKMMGLAPYGDDTFLKQIKKEEWIKEKFGSLFVNARISFPRGGGRAESWNFRRVIGAIIWKCKDILLKLKKYLQKHLVVQGGPTEETFFFPKVHISRPSRNISKDRLPDDYYTSVAYAIQKLLEEVTYWWGMKLKKITNSF